MEISAVKKTFNSGVIVAMLLLSSPIHAEGSSTGCFGEVRIFEERAGGNCESYSPLSLGGKKTKIHVCDSGPFVVNGLKEVVIEEPQLNEGHPDCGNPSFLVSGCAFKVSLFLISHDREKFSDWLHGRLPGEFIAVWEGQEILHQRWREDYNFPGLRVGYLMQSELDMRIFEALRGAAERCESD